MISDFPVCTVYFPIVNYSYPKFHIDTTHLEQGRILQINFIAHVGHVTCIHCKAVDLPEFKEEQGIPKQYSLNRILSKVQKSFWSCTHVNSCPNYTLYINLHILLNI